MLERVPVPPPATPAPRRWLLAIGRRRGDRTELAVRRVPDVDPSPAPDDKPVMRGPDGMRQFVVQSKTVADTTRLLLLAGDPANGWNRACVATLEVGRCCGHPDTVSDLIQRLADVLDAHGRAEWERQERVERWMRRAHLELAE